MAEIACAATEECILRMQSDDKPKVLTECPAHAGIDNGGNVDFDCEIRHCVSCSSFLLSWTKPEPEVQGHCVQMASSTRHVISGSHNVSATIFSHQQAISHEWMLTPLFWARTASCCSHTGGWAVTQEDGLSPSADECTRLSGVSMIDLLRAEAK